IYGDVFGVEDEYIGTRKVFYIPGCDCINGFRLKINSCFPGEMPYNYLVRIRKRVRIFFHFIVLSIGNGTCLHGKQEYCKNVLNSHGKGNFCFYDQKLLTNSLTLMLLLILLKYYGKNIQKIGLGGF